MKKDNTEEQKSKKKKIILLLLLLLLLIIIGIFLFTRKEKKTYIVNFLDKNDKIIYSTEVVEGQTPEFTGIVEVIYEGDYKYEFFCWSDYETKEQIQSFTPIKESDKDVINYKALYTETYAGERKDAEISDPSVISGLVYKGVDQNLINEFTKSTGKVMYSITNTKVQPEKDTFTENLPQAKNAGTYYIWYYTLGNEMYKESEVLCIEVTIDKANGYYNSEPTAISNIKYDTFNHNLINAAKSNAGTVLYALSESNITEPTDGYSTTIPTGKEVKTYYVWYKLVGDVNHKDINAKCISAQIGKGTAHLLTNITAKTGLVYTSVNQQLINVGTATGTIMYKVTETNVVPTDKTGFTSEVPSKTDAKDYYIWTYVQGDDNYLESAISSTSVKVTIAPTVCTLSVSPTAKTGLTYTGSPMDLITSATSTNGTVKYVLSSSNTIAPNSGYNTTIPQATNVSTYYIWYIVTPNNTNYKQTTPVCLTVSIGKTMATVTTAPTIKDLTYTSLSLSLVNAGSTNDGTIKYALSISNSIAPTVFNTTIPTGINANTYYVWYKVFGDSNHSDSTPVCLTAQIKKADGSISTNPTVKTGLVYTSSSLNLLDTLAISSTGTVYYAITSKDAPQPDVSSFTTSCSAINAGEYNIYFYSKGDDNHKDTTITSTKALYDQAGIVTIEPKDGTITTLPKAITGLVYNGSSHSLITAGSSNDGTVVYTLGNNNSEAPNSGYSSTIPTGKNAGTYYVWYKLQPDNNHKATTPACIQVVIDKAEGSISTDPTIKTDLIYTGSPIDVITPASTSTGTMYYAIVGLNDSQPDISAFTTSYKITAVGVYKVYYYSKGDENHYDSDIKNTVTKYGFVDGMIVIDKAVAVKTDPTFENISFTGSQVSLVKTPGQSDHGKYMYAIKYTPSQVPQSSDYSENVPTAVDEGVYYVWYKFVGDDNHIDGEPTKVMVTISND